MPGTPPSRGRAGVRTAARAVATEKQGGVRRKATAITAGLAAGLQVAELGPCRETPGKG